MPPALGPDILDRMERAVEAVRRRLLRATAALDAARLPYAVIGEQAVAAWVARVDESAVRCTPDVDILLDRASLDAATIALRDAGFVPGGDAIVGTVFLEQPGVKVRDAVRIVFAGERVRGEDCETAPNVAEFEPFKRFRVLKLPALVRMKLIANRNKDRMNFIDMVDVGLIDAGWVATLPAELGARLRDVIETFEREQL